MNNNLKRFLSSVLAFVILLSCMMVVNVSSVWAAETNFGSLAASSSNLGSDTAVNDEVTVGSGCRPTATTVGGYSIVIDTRSGNSVNNSKNAIVVKPKTSGNMVVKYHNNNNKGRSLNVTESGAAALNVVESGVAYSTSEVHESTEIPVEAGKTYYIGGSSAIFIFAIDLPSGGSDTDYTIQGTTTPALPSGATFNLVGSANTFTATVGENGAYTATLNLASAPTDTTYTVSGLDDASVAAGYSIPASTTVTADFTSATTVSNADFNVTYTPPTTYIYEIEVGAKGAATSVADTDVKVTIDGTVCTVSGGKASLTSTKTSVNYTVSYVGSTYTADDVSDTLTSGNPSTTVTLTLAEKTSGIQYPSSSVEMKTYLPGGYDATSDANVFKLVENSVYNSSNDRFEIARDDGTSYISFIVANDCQINVTVSNKIAALYNDAGNTIISDFTGSKTVDLTVGKYYFVNAGTSGTGTARITALSFVSNKAYDITPSFNMDVTGGTVTINDVTYTSGTISLAPGSYPVVYTTTDSVVYKGTLVVAADGTAETVTLAETGKVRLYESDGTTLKAKYDTISEAVSAATAGDVIKLVTGTYTENVTINKSVTIESESGSNDVIIEMNNGAQTKLGENAVVRLTADGVTLKNLTIRNTYNLDGNSDAVSQTPALNIDKTSSGNTITNCVLESVQDTLLIQDSSTADTDTESRAVFNDCTIAGGTDFVCGTGLVTFNKCTFSVILYKYDSKGIAITDNKLYVFAPTPYSTFIVNGGSIVYDTKYYNDETVGKDYNAPPTSRLYYARIWDKSSMDSFSGYKDGENIKLYLNGVSSVEVNKTSQSMNGFYCQSINGNIPITSAWFNIYDTQVSTPDNSNYNYSTHDANLFDYKGVLMVDNKLVIYGDFIAGTGTGTGKDGKEDPVLATVEKLGILVDSETYDANKAVETTYVFNKLVNGTDAICNGNPYTTFCVIDFTGTDLATSPADFKLRTFTKYASTDDYNISNEYWTVSVDENGANVTVN